MAPNRQRKVVLRNLIALGEVGIEVVLAVELAELGNLAAQRQGGANRELDAPTVDNRERPREGQADRAGVAVGLAVEVGGGAGAKHLAPRQQLGVDLEADDGFDLGPAVDLHLTAPVVGSEEARPRAQPEQSEEDDGADEGHDDAAPEAHRAAVAEGSYDQA